MEIATVRRKIWCQDEIAEGNWESYFTEEMKMVFDGKTLAMMSREKEVDDGEKILEGIVRFVMTGVSIEQQRRLARALGRKK